MAHIIKGIVMNTPSPEIKRTKTMFTTPVGVCRKILGSPGFLSKAFTDISELSMSPLQLLDTPIKPTPITPGNSSGETPRSDFNRVQQSSTPSENRILGTSSVQNKAFFIPSTVYTSVKAKRRLIEDEKPSAVDLNRGNAAKKQKVMPTSYSKPIKYKTSSKKRRLGHINAGVSHRIPRPKPSRKVTCGKKPQRKSPDSKMGIKEETKEAAQQKSNDFVGLKNVVVEKTPSVSEKTIEHPLLRQESESPSTKPMLKNKDKVKAVENKLAIVPKVITRNWNQHQNRTETRERKFFKSRTTTEDSPSRIVTVSVNENLKLQIHENKPVKTRKSPRKSPRKQMEIYKPVLKSVDINIDMLHQDWNDAEESEEISTSILEILNGLSEEESVGLPNSSTFLVEQKENNSGAQKLFPLFNKNAVKIAPPALSENKAPSLSKNNLKLQWERARKEGENQRIMDAGQKAFGATQCKECMLVYHIKEPEDELLHVKIHESFKDMLKFTGWKKERIVRRYSQKSYVVAIIHGDPAYCWNKVNNVLKNIVDNELGFSEIGIRKPETTKVNNVTEEFDI